MGSIIMKYNTLDYGSRILVFALLMGTLLLLIAAGLPPWLAVLQSIAFFLIACRRLSPGPAFWPSAIFMARGWMLMTLIPAGGLIIAREYGGLSLPRHAPLVVPEIIVAMGEVMVVFLLAEAFHPLFRAQRSYERHAAERIQE